MAPIYDAGRPHPLLLPRDDGVESAPNIVAIVLVCIMAVMILAGLIGLAQSRHNRRKKAKQREIIINEQLRRRREWRDFVMATICDQENAYPMRPIARTRGYPPGSADNGTGFVNVDLDGPTATTTTSNSRYGNIDHRGTYSSARRYSVNPYSPYGTSSPQPPSPRAPPGPSPACPNSHTGQGFPYCSGYPCECPPSQPSSSPSRLPVRDLRSEYSTGPSALESVPPPPPPGVTSSSGGGRRRGRDSRQRRPSNMHVHFSGIAGDEQQQQQRRRRQQPGSSMPAPPEGRPERGGGGGGRDHRERLRRVVRARAIPHIQLMHSSVSPLSSPAPLGPVMPVSPMSVLAEEGGNLAVSQRGSTE